MSRKSSGAMPGSPSANDPSPRASATHRGGGLEEAEFVLMAHAPNVRKDRVGDQRIRFGAVAPERRVRTGCLNPVGDAAVEVDAPSSTIELLARCQEVRETDARQEES